MRFDNWHHNGICLKMKKNGNFIFCCSLLLFEKASPLTHSIFSFFLLLLLQHHIIFFISLTSLYARNSFCLLLSHIYVNIHFLLLLLFFWNSVIEHKLQEQRAARREEMLLQLNCVSIVLSKSEWDTHAHDNKTTKRQLSMKFLLLYILLELSASYTIKFHYSSFFHLKTYK